MRHLWWYLHGNGFTSTAYLHKGLRPHTGWKLKLPKWLSQERTENLNSKSIIPKERVSSPFILLVVTLQLPSCLFVVTLLVLFCSLGILIWPLINEVSALLVNFNIIEMTPLIFLMSPERDITKTNLSTQEKQIYEQYLENRQVIHKTRRDN